MENKIRDLRISPNFTIHAEGSVLIELGQTKVICNATIEDKVPPFLRGQGKGWITAEYSMLPRATQKRTIREAAKGKITGRTMEIQRLIGRSLRAVMDLNALGERTIWVDCDVIQADGGTRTASISGAFVAVAMACQKLVDEEILDVSPIQDYLGAISVGVLSDGEIILDLDYEADYEALVDMNIVMTGEGKFVEIQGTGEEATFSHRELLNMLEKAKDGIDQVIDKQKDVLGKNQAKKEA